MHQPSSHSQHPNGSQPFVQACESVGLGVGIACASHVPCAVTIYPGAQVAHSPELSEAHEVQCGCAWHALKYWLLLGQYSLSHFVHLVPMLGGTGKV